MIRPVLADGLVFAGSVRAEAFTLDLSPGAAASLAGFMINANSIGKATPIGRYGRKQ